MTTLTQNTRDADAGADTEWPLSSDEYQRYGRQMIMPEWGLQGQLALRNSRIAVIGAGGLGCPLLQYLAGAGVGHISIFDHDTVSGSNLHRQVLHTTERVGMNKAESARIALNAINPHVEITPHPDPVLPSTACAQLATHDLLIDCTDRPYTRYLLADAAAALGLPLVSGAAVGAAGQWAVYSGTWRADRDAEPQRRACYRCVWPRPGASARCDEAGVWGPVTGMVGSGMAAAALSVLMGSPGAPVLHILHLGGSPMVRTVRMRGPRADCVCANGIRPEDEDYDAFCGTVEVDERTGAVPGAPGERIGATDLRDVLSSPDVLVVDTRPAVEYAICALPNTQNIPLATILASPETLPAAQRTVFLCRRGNDSQLAAAALRASRPSAVVQDVRGGLGAWTREVDPRFPVY